MNHKVIADDPTRPKKILRVVLLLILLGLFLAGLIFVLNSTLYEDGSASTPIGGFCLITDWGCSDFLGEEWLWPNDLPEGSLILGVYDPDGYAHCYHELNLCILRSE